MIDKALFLKLAEAISDCTETVIVCVPDEGYYARPTDFTTDKISVINPQRLKDKLLDLFLGG